MTYIDEAPMSRKFNIKAKSFSGMKTDDMFHYLVSLLEKNLDYVNLPSGTNDATDHQSNNIERNSLKETFKLKEFIHLKVPSCKVIISTPIKRHE